MMGVFSLEVAVAAGTRSALGAYSTLPIVEARCAASEMPWQAILLSVEKGTCTVGGDAFSGPSLPDIYPVEIHRA